MTNQTVDYQATMYVYDLGNCAKEFGFKADEGWELSLANVEEKFAIEKKYYPTISTKVLPEILLELSRMVKTKMVHSKTDMHRNMDGDVKSDRNLQYLVAFNPKRERH